MADADILHDDDKYGIRCLLLPLLLAMHGLDASYYHFLGLVFSRPVYDEWLTLDGCAIVMIGMFMADRHDVCAGRRRLEPRLLAERISYESGILPLDLETAVSVPCDIHKLPLRIG